MSRAAGAITIDGSLDDPGWQGAAEIRNFYEISPGDNTAPKVRTTAWITYDDRFFYVAIKCDDPRPAEIRAQHVERDHVSSDQDFAGIMLDTRNDERTAIEFFVNPYGIQDDIVRDESVVNGNNEDTSPDFHWDSAARITREGWQLEMRIPFSSLRYGGADPQTWGITVFRNLVRDFRYQIASNRAPRESSCFICHAAKL
ncbi:MAG TPA: carbohydrate binding family 9 domain-containing protein, partial [Thermoanaerobaculia bacterium]|nr:carbohydrate binding family 9 domain-containing protein [Thermoanaerobaculia bacterium]